MQVKPAVAPLTIGWHDEFNGHRAWKPISIQNAATATEPVPGALRLALGRVPANWPYEYQWSGVTRRIKVDVGRYPFLSAYVSELMGYAHLDIDVLDAKGRPVKSLRSSMLQAGGVCFIDFSGVLDPAIYTLQLKLIVGGSNQGCWGTYNWVRFSSVKDGELMKASPNERWVRN